MPYTNNYAKTTWVNESTQPTGTPDLDATNLNHIENGIYDVGEGLETYSSDLEALEATVAGITGFSDPGYISGLQLEYVSTTQIRVKSGTCYVPGPASLASATADTILTPSLSASAWHYVYAVIISNALNFEVSTTAPIEYRGRARQKTGDATRRHIGTFKTNASSQPFPFLHFGNRYRYLTDVYAAPFKVLTAGVATAETAVSCAAVVPPTSRCFWGKLFNTSSAQSEKAFFGVSDDNITLGSTTSTYPTVAPALHIGPGGAFEEALELPLNASQEFTYRLAGTPSAGEGAHVHVYGYYEDRF